MSRPYISQVKHGKRPPSRRLLEALTHYRSSQTKIDRAYLRLFLQSRQATGASLGTIRFYNVKLGLFLAQLDPDKASRHDIETFLLQFDNLGNRHAYFRAIRTFYRWREESFSLPNPMTYMKAPSLDKPILPSLTRGQVLSLIQQAQTLRDRAIIALLTESGLRLSELANIEPGDINWESHTIQVMGKGRKESLAPFGELTDKYLRAWLHEYSPNGNIWGINAWGIVSMLRRLKARTGLPCNPHTFRRTFASLLRKAGTDSLTIKDLGRWESLEMVQRYTRSVTFGDSLKHYRAPLS